MTHFESFLQLDRNLFILGMIFSFTNEKELINLRIIQMRKTNKSLICINRLVLYEIAIEIGHECHEYYRQ